MIPPIPPSVTPLATTTVKGKASFAAANFTVTSGAVAIKDLTGVITSVGNVTSIANQTGTGSTFVVNTSPTFVTQITVPKILATGSNLLLIPTADGTTSFQIGDKDSNVLMNVDTTNDRIGFGTIAPTVFFQVVKSNDVSVSTEIFKVAPTFTAASAPGTIYPTALSFNPIYNSAENYAGFMMGQYVNTRTDGTGGGNVRAVDINILNSNTATIPSARCVNIRSVANTGSGSITDIYGIYIDDQSGISVNAPFAIKTWGGQVQIINSVAAEYALKVSKNVASSSLPPALIVQDSTTGVTHVLELQQDDVDEPYIKFTGATVATGKTAADEYIKVETASGDRYIRLYT